MNGSRLQTVGTALTALLGAFIILAGIGLLLGALISETGVGLDSVEETDAAWYIVVGLPTIFAGALVLSGLFMIKSPWPAAGAVSAGALVLLVMWNWIWPVTVPVAVAMTAFAVFRARELSRERGRAAASPAG